MRRSARPMPGYPGHRRDRGVPLLSVDARHLEQHLSHGQPGHLALPGPDAQYSVYAVGLIPIPRPQAAVRDQVQALTSTLSPSRASTGTRKQSRRSHAAEHDQVRRRLRPLATRRSVSHPEPAKNPHPFRNQEPESRAHRQESSGTTAISRAKVGDNLGAIAGCLFDIDADLGGLHRRGQRTRLRRQHARSAVSRHGDSWDGRACVVAVSRTAGR